MRDLREQQHGGTGEVAVASTLWTTLCPGAVELAAPFDAVMI